MGHSVHWRWALLIACVALLKGALFTYLAILFYPEASRGWFWFFAIYAGAMWAALAQSLALAVRLRREQRGIVVGEEETKTA